MEEFTDSMRKNLFLCLVISGSVYWAHIECKSEVVYIHVVHSQYPRCGNFHDGLIIVG